MQKKAGRHGDEESKGDAADGGRGGGRAGAGAVEGGWGCGGLREGARWGDGVRGRKKESTREKKKKGRGEEKGKDPIAKKRTRT